MARKLMNLQTADGRAIRVTVGTKGARVITPERIIDPTGVLTVSGPYVQTEEDKAAFTEFRRKVQSGEIKIEYP